MSTEQNKAIMRRFADESSNSDQTALKTLLAPNFVFHQGNGTANRDEFLQHMKYYLTAFSDTSLTVEQQVAEGDIVVTRGIWRGTHTGDFQSIPPTGKQFAINAVLFDRIVDGKIVEHRGQFDVFSMMQQLGMVPAS